MADSLHRFQLFTTISKCLINFAKAALFREQGRGINVLFYTFGRFFFFFFGVNLKLHKNSLFRNGITWYKRMLFLLPVPVYYHQKEHHKYRVFVP